MVQANWRSQSAITEQHALIQKVVNLIHIGSVGKPKDGTPKGCYVLLTMNQDSSITNKDAVQVEFIRFEYDVEKAAKAVEDSPLPNEFAAMLRKSY